MVALALAVPGTARADNVVLSADQPLRFGTMVVPGSGSRTISASGGVTDSNLFAVSGPTGPAQFTLSVDRGGSSNVVSVVVQIVLPSVPSVTQAGVTGTLSALATDLPGLPLLVPGQFASFTISNCATRICTLTFHVGGRIDIVRSSGGAALTFALPVTATVLAVL